MTLADAPPRRRWVRVTVLAMTCALLGALVGLAIGLATPAHVEIAGSDTQVQLEFGSTVDQVGVTGVVTLTRATDRAVLGEPVGVRAVLDFDASDLVSSTGTINTDVLPAYVAAYSDPNELVGDIRHELIAHVLRFVVGGAVLALLLYGAARWYAWWRRRYDRTHFADGRARATARRYRARERAWTWRTVGAVVLVAVLAAIPSAHYAPPSPRVVRPNPILADTPLNGIEVDGLLSPALVAARDYVQTYFGQTDKYYEKLRDKLATTLDEQPLDLSTDDDVTNIGFVTDRHCNTGMDRVDIGLFKRLGVHTLVSAGDDAFSGTFAFESACTRNLAQQSANADIKDVMVGGNHDSQQTVDDEKQQKMVTLTGDVVEVNGLRFVGSPDPRSSRYGEGIQPPTAAGQAAAIDAQARKVAATGCNAEKPVIAVLHDPNAGTQALREGCGRITLALDGHTHKQAGPVDVALADGSTGQQFTGGSAGGAPGEQAVDRTFASSLTVGPLHHDAFVYVLSVERSTGRLAGLTTFRFTPSQDIEVTQSTV